jgi:hypothetical protein
LIDQRTVPGQGRQQGIEQGRTVLPVLQVIVNAPCLGQAIAELAQIAWAAPAGHQPPKRSADVGRSAQYCAQIAAQ